ncbi:hypothetical protein FACS1894111_06540 [Clostridia bacterium]|nr:hypothetical protein FACS1894111_06540 [Clostridia bacterium]
MNIVYLGSDLLLGAFRFLHKNHRILALYTFHNTEDYFRENAIVELAEKNNIPVFYEPITEARIRQHIEEEHCDLFFCGEYIYYLPVPEHTNFRGVNTHMSLLPEGRGYYPVEGAIESGLSESGVTLHKIEPALDGGDILLQEKVLIKKEHDSIDLYLTCAAKAVEMLQLLMSDFEVYWQSAFPQGATRPYCKRFGQEKMVVSHELTCGEAQAIYRVHNQETRVQIGGIWRYVAGMTASSVSIGREHADIRFIREDRILYPLADGHLRLFLERDE